MKWRQPEQVFRLYELRCVVAGCSCAVFCEGALFMTCCTENSLTHSLLPGFCTGNWNSRSGTYFAKVLISFRPFLIHCGLVTPYGDTDRSGSALAQVMACCLMAPSHYLNQCWLIINEVQWQLPDMRAISQEMPQPSVAKISLKFTWITFLKFASNLPGANELFK